MNAPAATDTIEFYDADSAPQAENPSPRSPSTLAQVVAEIDDQMQGPEEPELPAERERTLRAPGFTRMPLSWHDDYAPMVHTINAMAEARIAEDYVDLFEIVNEIEHCALVAGADRVTGERVRPDYAAIAESDKQHWVIQLSVNQVAWEQKAARYWGEAMFAKVKRQEVFTTGYLGVTGRSTVEDRTQAGQNASLEDYYFAVLCGVLHKRAEAACASARVLCQRLKDASFR